jgi:hypothetical protein
MPSPALAHRWRSGPRARRQSPQHAFLRFPLFRLVLLRSPVECGQNSPNVVVQPATVKIARMRWPPLAADEMGGQSRCALEASPCAKT